MARNPRSGFTLVATLIVIAIIAILVIVMYGNGGGIFGSKVPARADGKGQTMIGSAKYAAKDDECRNGLDQIRASIAINTDPVDNTRPATLQDTHLGAQFYKCPVGGEPYVYDPKTGTVHCPHPGHERY